MKISTYFLIPILPKFWEGYEVEEEKINGSGWFRKDVPSKTIKNADITPIHRRILWIKLNWGDLKIEPPSREAMTIKNVSNLRFITSELKRIAEGKPLPIDVMNRRKISEAQSKKEIDFCPIIKDKLEEENISSSFGEFIIHGNGTVSDLTSGLMWIQAPWGYNWNGKKFEGEPIEINWETATKFFGKGISVFSSGGGLIEPKLSESKFDSNYISGKCKVNFAGYSDWRLPTASELNTISLIDREKYRNDDEDAKLREKIFPFSVYGSWSATSKESTLAWASDGQSEPGDYQKYDKKRIYLVRKK